VQRTFELKGNIKVYLTVAGPTSVTVVGRKLR